MYREKKLNGASYFSLFYLIRFHRFAETDDGMVS